MNLSILKNERHIIPHKSIKKDCKIDNNTDQEAKYIAEFQKCGRQIEYDKRRSISCGRCDNKFNPKYRMVFRENPKALQLVYDNNTLTEVNIAPGRTYDNTEVSNR